MANLALINGGAINGATEALLEIKRGAGDGLTAFGAVFDGVRLRTGAAAPGVLGLSATAQPVLRRGLAAQAQLDVGADYQASVTRHAGGIGGITFASSLYYSRTQLGSGDAVIRLRAAADIGIAFGVADAWLTPITPSLAAARVRTASGAAYVVASAELAASADRRFSSDGAVQALDGLSLDPAHITAGGVRYLTAGVALPITLLGADAGVMRLVSQLGAAMTEVGAETGHLSVIRRSSTPSDATLSVTLSQAFQVQRKLRGALVLSLEARGEADIVVEGQGSAMPLMLTAELDPSARRRSLAGEILTQLELSGGGERRKGPIASADMSLLAASGTVKAIRRARGGASVETAFSMSGQRTTEMTGAVELRVDAETDGLMLRAGNGDVPIDVALELTGSAKRTIEDVGFFMSAFDAGMVGVRRVALEGPAALLLDADYASAVIRVGDGDAAMEVLTSSDAYLNPYAHDPNEQTFDRPYEQRDFRRPADQRDFKRAA